MLCHLSLLRNKQPTSVTQLSELGNHASCIPLSVCNYGKIQLVSSWFNFKCNNATK